MTEAQIDQMVDAIDDFHEKLTERAGFFPDAAFKITASATPTIIGVVLMEGYEKSE